MTIWYQSFILEKPRYTSRLQLQVEAMEKQNVDFGKVLIEIQESLAALNRAQGETQAAIVKLDQGVSHWRPQMESVGELHQQLDLVNKLNQASSTTSSPRVPLTDEERKAPLQSAPPATSSPRVPLTDEERKALLLPTPPASRVAAAGDSGDKWASGRQHPNEHRGRAPGVVTTVVPTSVKGTFSSPAPSLGILDWENDFDSGERRFNHRVPKLDFPKFDGSDPHDWRMKCEHYFDVNNTYPGLWVRVSIIYFSGRAASWLRSTRAHLRFPNWEDFCAAVSDKFDRDQHDSLIRQMDQIK